MDLNNDITKNLLDNYITLVEEEKEDSESSSDSEVDGATNLENQADLNARSIPIKKRKMVSADKVEKKENLTSKDKKEDREIFELIRCSELQNLTDYESEIVLSSEILTANDDLKEYKIKNLRVD